MLRYATFSTAILSLIGLLSTASAQTDSRLQSIADQALAKNHTPGLIVAVLSEAHGLESAAAGHRKWDDPTKITPEDKMHLGSCTKALTSVLIARLIEKDKLRWDTRVSEQLPKPSAKIHEAYHDITIEQLLTHTSGMPSSAANWWLAEGDTITERREIILHKTLNKAPKTAPGEKYVYSNFGYMTAGLMAAKAAELSWEQALTSEVFQPLGITTAGFGVPGETGKVNQPWGHRKTKQGKYIAVQGDNAPALGPAGTVHMSISDWAKFINVFLDRGPEDFLTSESIDQLKTPSKVHKYAKGWGVLKRRWGKGTVLNHAGSNTTWYANVWVAPETGQAYFVCMNCASEEAMQQADELIGQLIQYLQTRDTR